MNILMIGPYPPPYGGIAVVVRNLMSSCIKDRFNLKLLKTAPIKTGTSIENFIRISIDLHAILKNMIFFRPEIVHIHTSYDWGWPKHVSYAIIAKIFGCKVILHMHAYHRGCRNEFPKVWLKRLIFPPMFVFKIVDCIFTLSDTYTNVIKKFTNKIVITIPNGIDIEKFSNRKTKTRHKDCMTISYIGTIEKRKGIYKLMLATDIMIKEISNIQVVIAGDGPARDDIIKWQNILQSKNVTYLGKISEERKIQILKDSDIFILQSENEGIPIAILEAIASGCAIITTSVGNIPEVVKNNINGILIPHNDENALINAITVLKYDHRLLVKIQENNLKERYKYSLDMISKKIIESYQRIYDN